MSSNRVALVTGGARGLGRAACATFVAHHHQVVVADIDGETAAATARELGTTDVALAITVDVTSSRSVDQMVTATLEHFGRLDVLVNNAGFIRPQPSHEVTDDDWQALIDVHLGGTFRCARAAYGALATATSSAIVNIASVVARRGMPMRLSYSAAKAGIEALTRTLAVEWATAGIRVNAVAPGFIHTPAVDRALAAGLVDEGRLDRLTPTARMGKPEEVAAAIVFLASPEASYVNGHTLVVDGGLTVSAGAWSEPER